MFFFLCVSAPSIACVELTLLLCFVLLMCLPSAHFCVRAAGTSVEAPKKKYMWLHSLKKKKKNSGCLSFCVFSRCCVHLSVIKGASRATPRCHFSPPRCCHDSESQIGQTCNEAPNIHQHATVLILSLQNDKNKNRPRKCVIAFHGVD